MRYALTLGVHNLRRSGGVGVLEGNRAAAWMARARLASGLDRRLCIRSNAGAHGGSEFPALSLGQSVKQVASDYPNLSAPVSGANGGSSDRPDDGAQIW